MKQYGILLVTVLAVILALPAVSAGPFSTAFSAIDNEILPNETASFELQISNFGPTPQRFQVYTIDPNWVMKIDPISVRVPPSSSETFTITLNPKTNVPYGSQGITINVKELESGDLVRKNLFVAVQRYGETAGTFQPSVSFDVAIPALIDPRDTVPVTVHLRNRNQLDIKDMTLRISSPHYAYETLLDLEPLAESTKYLTMDLQPGETPGEFLLRGTLTYRGSVVTQLQKGYEIGAFADVTSGKDTRTFLFKTTNVYTLRNDGNADDEITVRQPANFIERLFSNTEPQATYVSGEYVWVENVPASGVMTLTHTKNYRYFVIALFIILIAVVVYFRVRSPVLGTKEAVGLVKGEGMSDLKVRLFVKNRSNQVVQGVEVYDKVPRIADLDKTHEVGTLKPDKVTQLKSGTLLHWKLDVLEPYEERILTYTLKSKLKIVGQLRMPEAKIKFETRKGQERVVYSNNILVIQE